MNEIERINKLIDKIQILIADIKKDFETTYNLHVREVKRNEHINNI